MSDFMFEDDDIRYTPKPKSVKKMIMLDEKEYAELTARITALEVALTNAAEKWVVDADTTGEWKCLFCGNEAIPFRSVDEPDNDDNNGWKCDHEADCPTQWNGLTK